MDTVQLRITKVSEVSLNKINTRCILFKHDAIDEYKVIANAIVNYAIVSGEFKNQTIKFVHLSDTYTAIVAYTFENNIDFNTLCKDLFTVAMWTIDNQDTSYKLPEDAKDEPAPTEATEEEPTTETEEENDAWEK